MKVVIIILGIISSVLIDFTAHAKGICNQTVESLGAKYLIKKTLLAPQSQDKKSTNNEVSFELWRKGNDVMHLNSAKQLTVFWHKLNNSNIRQVNYFDQYQRGIEFEPAKLSNSSWENTIQLVSEKQLTKMTLLTTEGKGCELIEHYQLNTGDISTDIWWQPAIKIAHKIIYNDSYYSTVWLLTEVVSSIDEVEKVFKQRLDYQMTDYADIGDNESDPFLRKMIHLGFVKHGSSGFYDANGNKLSGGHSH